MTVRQDIPDHGRRIRHRLTEMKWSQRRLAEALDIHPAVLSKYVRGEIGLPVEVAIAIERVIGIPAEETMALQMNEQVQALRVRIETLEKQIENAPAAMVARIVTARKEYRQGRRFQDAS